MALIFSGQNQRGQEGCVRKMDPGPFSLIDFGV
jgi:hypothetical protein